MSQGKIWRSLEIAIALGLIAVCVAYVLSLLLKLPFDDSTTWAQKLAPVMGIACFSPATFMHVKCYGVFNRVLRDPWQALATCILVFWWLLCVSLMRVRPDWYFAILGVALLPGAIRSWITGVALSRIKAAESLHKERLASLVWIGGGLACFVAHFIVSVTGRYSVGITAVFNVLMCFFAVGVFVVTRREWPAIFAEIARATKWQTLQGEQRLFWWWESRTADARADVASHTK